MDNSCLNPSVTPIRLLFTKDLSVPDCACAFSKPDFGLNVSLFSSCTISTDSWTDLVSFWPEFSKVIAWPWILYLTESGIIIGFLGIFSGVTFSSLIYYLQSNYHVIKLSSEIYFLEYLPVKINYNQIFFILIFILSTVTLFSFIPANIIKKTNPPETLKEN